MKQPLHILHLEENDKDSELIRRSLAEAGMACEVTRVETCQDFEAALGQGGFDLILTEYCLPAFDGLSALNIGKERRPEVPFIFVSRWFEDEAAVEAVKRGATDYVFKHRLSPGSRSRLNARWRRRMKTKRAEKWKSPWRKP